ncbi:MAG: LEA type 2 family protein [Treponema sp.]|nr:LEA type 2 family protein [Treponema sp.]
MKTISVLGSAALAFFVMTACKTIPSIINEPSVSFESVVLTGINFNGADMKARIKIQNNNPFSIPFPEITWKLFVTDAPFLSGVVKNNNKIAANNAEVIELPFTVSYDGLYKALDNLIRADEAPYRVDLSARFSLPVLDSKIFSASFSGSLPMLKTPALSFSGIHFNSLGLSKVEFVLTWLADNKNAFAINLEKLDYGFSVNGVSWTSGTAPRVSLPARRTIQIPVTVSINSLSMIQEIAALAAEGKAVNYTCGGEAVLSPQGFENFAALRLPFSYSGTTSLMR